MTCRSVDGKLTRLVVDLDTDFHLNDLSRGVRGQRLPLLVGGAVRDEVLLVESGGFLRGRVRARAGGNRFGPNVKLCELILESILYIYVCHGKIPLASLSKCTTSRKKHGTASATLNSALTPRGSPHTKWRLAISLDSTMFPFSASGTWWSGYAPAPPCASKTSGSMF